MKRLVLTNKRGSEPLRKIAERISAVDTCDGDRQAVWRTIGAVEAILISAGYLTHDPTDCASPRTWIDGDTSVLVKDPPEDATHSSPVAPAPTARKGR